MLSCTAAIEPVLTQAGLTCAHAQVFVRLKGNGRDHSRQSSFKRHERRRQLVELFGTHHVERRCAPALTQALAALWGSFQHQTGLCPDQGQVKEGRSLTLPSNESSRCQFSRLEQCLPRPSRRGTEGGGQETEEEEEESGTAETCTRAFKFSVLRPPSNRSRSLLESIQTRLEREEVDGPEQNDTMMLSSATLTCAK